MAYHDKMTNYDCFKMYNENFTLRKCSDFVCCKIISSIKIFKQLFYFIVEFHFKSVHFTSNFGTYNIISAASPIAY